MSGQHRKTMAPADAEFLEQLADNGPAFIAFVVVPLTPSGVALWSSAVDAVRLQVPRAASTVPAWVWLAITVGALVAGTVAHFVDQRRSS